MRLVTLLAGVGLLALSGIAFAAEPYGVWLRPSTSTQLRFYNCGDKLCAKVAAVKSQAHQSEVGKVIVPGAAKSGGDTWTGDIIDISAGRTYSGVITLQGPNALNVKGCFLGFCRAETWTKVR
jgi:uncharacterized protein (DUF2147 family)